MALQSSLFLYRDAPLSNQSPSDSTRPPRNVKRRLSLCETAIKEDDVYTFTWEK